MTADTGHWCSPLGFTILASHMKSSESSETVESPTALATSDTHITLKFPRKTLWLFLGLLLLGGGGYMAWRWLAPPVSSQQPGGGPPQSISVKLQRLEASRIEEGTNFVGNLEAQAGVELKPEVEGRITQILVSSGTPVRPGQPIVQLNPDKSRAEFSAALAAITSARAVRSSAQAQLGAAKAEQARAAAELELQKTEYERTKGLVSEGVLARQELDRVTRDRNTASAALQATKEQVQAAQAELESAKAGVNQNAANAAALREDLQDNKITAPIAGIIGDIPVKVGGYVDIGDTLTTITQNQTLELKMDIPLERRNQLQLGLPVEVRSFQDQEVLATGTVSFISPTANAATQSVLAKARFRNDGQLQDAQRVAATVIWRERTGVLVPTTAISRLGGETFVFVADSSEEKRDALVARQRPVQLGSIQGNSYQILSGLRPGETIVVSGILNLSDGAPIQAQEP